MSLRDSNPGNTTDMYESTHWWIKMHQMPTIGLSYAEFRKPLGLEKFIDSIKSVFDLNEDIEKDLQFIYFLITKRFRIGYYLCDPSDPFLQESEFEPESPLISQLRTSSDTLWLKLAPWIIYHNAENWHIKMSEKWDLKREYTVPLKTDNRKLCLVTYSPLEKDNKHPILSCRDDLELREMFKNLKSEDEMTKVINQYFIESLKSDSMNDDFIDFVKICELEMKLIPDFKTID